MRLLQNEGCGGIVLLRLFRVRGDLFERIEPDRDLHALQLVAQHQIFLRLFRLLPERLDLHFQLGDFVSDAQQIVLRRRKTALRFLAAVAAFGDARRLLKNLAPVGAFDGKDLINPALPNVGIALTAEAGVHQQLVDIAQARRLLVDIVFALARAVIPAGNHDLRRFDLECAVLIIQHERRLGKADGRPLLRAAENNVLHLGAAQRPGALLAHDPADGVGNIGFSAAVRADDRCDIAPELQHRFIWKGLEALNFQ